MKLANISISSAEKLNLISNFSTMFSAGIPILETVEALLSDAKGNQKKLLETLREDLSQGKHVYYTFSKFPKIFDPVTVSIIKASEEAGTLDVTMNELKENIKKDMEFGDKVKSALIYPAFIVVVFGGVMLLMLTFVIPRISTVFSRLRVNLPLPTRILIFVSNTLLSYTIPVIIGVCVIAFFLLFLYKTQKKILMSLLLSLPVISRLAREIDLTRFAHSIYLLLNSGIPITSALELAQDVVAKKEVSDAIKRARETVYGGKKLSEGLMYSHHVVPTMMIKIIEAGEKSGSLDKSMQDISEYMDYQVSKSLRTVTALIEPLMLVLVGIMVGGMMLSIIAPIYGLIGQVGQH